MTTDSSDKDAYTEATQAEEIRTKLTTWAAGAVKHGVDRDWVNGWLAHLGAEPVTGQAEYRMNTAITGMFGWRCKASSRTEAAQRFQEQIARVAEAAKITADGSYDNVYDVEFTDATKVNFYSGPEDVEILAAPNLDLATLKSEARIMLRNGVAEQNWGYRYAFKAAQDMGLDPLPTFTSRTVAVPVAGTANVTVRAFDDADDDDMQRIVASRIKSYGSVAVVPDEVGAPVEVKKVNTDPFEDDRF